MKNRRLVIVLIIMTIVILLSFIVFKMKIYEKEQDGNKDEYKQIYENMIKNSIMYNEKTTIKELKQEYNYSGNDEIYQIEKEYDGRKSLVIKSEIDFNIAFAGMIKSEKPNIDEINTIVKDNMPTKTGIWIDEKSRSKILEYLNNNSLQQDFFIDSDGYLKIINKNSKYGQMLDDVVNSDRLCIISVNGSDYMINPVDGDVILNPFEDMASDQVYDSVKNEKSIIIFITNNKKKKLSNEEIVEGLLEVICNS